MSLYIEVSVLISCEFDMTLTKQRGLQVGIYTKQPGLPIFRSDNEHILSDSRIGTAAAESHLLTRGLIRRTAKQAAVNQATEELPYRSIRQVYGLAAFAHSLEKDRTGAVILVMLAFHEEVETEDIQDGDQDHKIHLQVSTGAQLPHKQKKTDYHHVRQNDYP